MDSAISTQSREMQDHAAWSSRPKRIRRRFPVPLPAKIFVRRFLKSTKKRRRAVLIEDTVTENVSSTGCYLFLSIEPEVGSKVRMEIEMLNRGAAQAATVLCRGRVVRVERDAQQDRFGVACSIDHYRIVSATATAARTAEPATTHMLSA